MHSRPYLIREASSQLMQRLFLQTVLSQERGLGFKYKIMVLLAQAKLVGSWRFGVTSDPLPQFFLSPTAQNLSPCSDPRL